MTRYALAFVLSCALAACGDSSTAPSTQFAATLSGASEVPANTSTGTGTASFTLSGTAISYSVTYSGLSGPPTGSHIHVGAAGASGSVVVPFSGLPSGTSGTFGGTFTAADVKAGTNIGAGSLDDLLVQMRAGNTYVNVHSSANAGGEIRGQIQPK